MTGASAFVNRGVLNIFSKRPLGRVLRLMLYLLVILVPILAWIASVK